MVDWDRRVSVFSQLLFSDIAALVAESAEQFSNRAPEVCEMRKLRGNVEKIKIIVMGTRGVHLSFELRRTGRSRWS